MFKTNFAFSSLVELFAAEKLSCYVQCSSNMFCKNREEPKQQKSTAFINQSAYFRETVNGPTINWWRRMLHFHWISFDFRSTPCIGSHRNFSLTPKILASVSAAAITAAENTSTLNIPEIPSTPAPSAIDETIIQALAANGEPTFASLGLGGHWPIGLLQNALEFMHVSFDLPWYATIALSTVVIRILLTPLVIITQRNAAKMRNDMPQMQEIQNKITEARQMGNPVELAQYNQQLMTLMRQNGTNPLKSMLIPFAQMPIFLSYFIGIRRMVNAPVESLHTGGALWFTDLTMADPFYILPVITCSTLALTIHLGTDGARMNQDSPLVNYVLKGLPIVIFPFIMNFPAAMVVYWASSNFCSLFQVKKIDTISVIYW